MDVEPDALEKHSRQPKRLLLCGKQDYDSTGESMKRLVSRLWQRASTGAAKISTDLAIIRIPTAYSIFKAARFFGIRTNLSST